MVLWLSGGGIRQHSLRFEMWSFKMQTSKRDDVPKSSGRLCILHLPSIQMHNLGVAPIDGLGLVEGWLGARSGGLRSDLVGRLVHQSAGEIERSLRQGYVCSLEYHTDTPAPQVIFSCRRPDNIRGVEWEQCLGRE